MLATTGNAILQQLRTHRLIKDKIRKVERLPELDLEALLKRYVADAPAYYLLPGTFRTVDDDMVITFTLAAVVRNSRGPDAAFAGDGQAIGLDHLLQLALRALHGNVIGPCSWRVVRGELVDDQVFDKTGLAALEIQLESSPIAIDEDWQMEELESFKTFHADFDLDPQAGEIEYQSWLQEPAPDYSNSRPDLAAHVSLQGA